MFRNAGAASPRNVGAPHMCGPVVVIHTSSGLRQRSYRGTEAGLDKPWSTGEPLGSFLKLAAAWAAKHHVDFQVTCLAGEKNAWADALSGNKPHVFQRRKAERRRFPLTSFLEQRGCVTLRPAGAAWPDEIRAAQHPQTAKSRLL